MDLAKISSKGRMTIPKRIRDRLGLHQGDVLTVETDGHRAVLSKISAGDTAHLTALETTLGEWLSDADEEAYRDL